MFGRFCLNRALTMGTLAVIFALVLITNAFDCPGPRDGGHRPWTQTRLVKQTHLNPDGGPLQNAKGGR